MNINDLKALLTIEELVVTFTKVDGSIRSMRCTLIADKILAETSGSSKPSNEVVVVWDLDKEAWRSFKFDSIIDIEICPRSSNG